MVIHMFHKLVHSARSNMKTASRGYCVLVFHSSGEPAAHPEDAFANVPGVSGSELEVGSETSWWSTHPCKESSHGLCIKFLTMFHIVSAIFGTFACDWFCLGVSEAAMTSSGWDDIPTEAETRSQFRRQRAVVTRLVPLTGSAPVPFASTSRERSRELSEKAFDKGMYHFRWGYFCGVPWLLLISCACCFRPVQ